MSVVRFVEPKKTSELDPESKVVVYYWEQGCSADAALEEMECPELHGWDDRLFVSSRLCDCHEKWNELEVHSGAFGDWCVVCKVKDLLKAVSALLDQVSSEYDHELRQLCTYAAAAIVQDKLQVAGW